MVRITAKAVRKRVSNLDKIIKKYKKDHPKKDRDYFEYEREFKRRLKKAIRNLDKLISESIRGIDVFYLNKDRHSLSLRKRMRLILVKELTEKGNRKTANMLELFSMLGGTDISYKTIERLYSDEFLQLAMFNLLILSLKKRGVKEIDACGDATGYSLTITKHYSSYVQKLKDKVKEQKVNEKKSFVYNFALMDLKTKMYFCYGSSLKSEKEAFDKAMQMLKNVDVKLKSIRLDRYYSCPVYVNQFKESNVYIIPKKTATLQHGAKWTETMGKFLFDTVKYLEEYFKRNNSESGWASDKKMFGWKISQKRYDRIDMALFVRMVWHNLILIYK
ncbi:MAG: ISNCY family transposase [Nanoarchaeota archaeon]